MATGVLSFVRGVDLSRNDFSGDRFPHDVEQMTQMTWLKLNRAKLERVIFMLRLVMLLCLMSYLVVLIWNTCKCLVIFSLVFMESFRIYRGSGLSSSDTISMISLRVLHMRSTNRTLDNIPPSLDDLKNLRSRRLAGQSSCSSVSSVQSGTKEKDPVARRKDFIRRRKQQADQEDASKVIQGMSKIAGVGAALKEREEEQQRIAARSAINWKGMWVWEIENFYPSLMDDAFHGQFYDADCYLILKSTKEISGNLRHDIFYWLGDKASLDKGMCAAVHAVGLRNHLNASCRTIREEMNDESEEFLELFGEEIVYIEGARTNTGFFSTEKPPHITRLYRASVNGTTVEMEPVPVTVESLDPRFCFLLDAGETIWIWSGCKARITIANKARLFAERINKRDRKGKAEIETCKETKTPLEFWLALTGLPEKPEESIVEHVPENFVPERKRLYQGEETMMFRSKFAGWDDIVPVDFTRTSESVGRVLVKRDNMMKTDLSALFLDRQPAMSPEESEELLNDCNEDLEFIESFVLVRYLYRE
uniref:Gelsolin-like domain-containing protein n=1 Tax=Heterorhabditis bacteriophora TaxID=37862 RepID=A0A1I7X9C4_HETBA